MKDKRLKFFQLTSMYLVGKNIKFKFEGYYLSASSLSFDLSFDSSDKSKVWVERNGDWKSFTDLKVFKSWLEKYV